MGNNVTIPGVPSLRSKMLNLIEVSLTCYNNHKEHEEHYQEQQREAHRQFQSRIASPVPSRNVLDLSASSSSTYPRQQKGNRNVTRNVTRNGNHSGTTRSSSSSVESMNRNASDSSNGTADVTTIAPPLPSGNINHSSPSMEERRTRRAVSMDETEASSH